MWEQLVSIDYIRIIKVDRDTNITKPIALWFPLSLPFQAISRMEIPGTDLVVEITTNSILLPSSDGDADNEPDNENF